MIHGKTFYVVGDISDADRYSNNFEQRIQLHTHKVSETEKSNQTKILVWSEYWPSNGYKLELNLQ